MKMYFFILDILWEVQTNFWGKIFTSLCFYQLLNLSGFRCTADWLHPHHLFQTICEWWWSDKMFVCTGNCITSMLQILGAHAFKAKHIWTTVHRFSDIFSIHYPGGVCEGMLLCYNESGGVSRGVSIVSIVKHHLKRNVASHLMLGLRRYQECNV